MEQAIAFVGAGLDRADHIRQDPDKLAGLMDWRARLLKLDGLDPVITPEGALAWGTLADAAPESDLVFLGLMGGKACFAEVSGAASHGAGPPSPRVWAAIATLEHSDIAVYGTARSLVDWHARHGFCARCGHATKLAKGGWQRSCTNEACRAEHFPRVDPVTIMLVEHDGKLLLGRQPRWPARLFSALAGFVEPGESIEEAVAREVLEESGVAVRDVQYVASQPWPFPSSLMIACHAMADSPELAIDHTELETARWFTREEVVAAMQGRDDAPFGAPPPHAVARHLMSWWLSR
ncbi:MAG: NAD(+) diphosphatase [Sphingomonadales bacterium]|nr:NAD(+) diphosphatase [Sphingomonadales bacterium]MDE2567408.1 NAD(+) diphosphatase [Sphingomonadales bacterium]